MFDKVLIANRGAIAVRVIRTLRAMNVKSVAVYAEADYGSRHVELADEAYSLGEGTVAQTYLDQAKLIAVARQSGARAVHPGYGFLSENAAFVQACEAAGLVFLGPTTAQMEAFGLKHTAKELAARAGVPLCPGSGLLSDVAAARAAAAAIGYPVMLKSTAGGGGIGMQRCRDDAELEAAFEKVRRLSANNFGSDGVFLEKLVVRARHIEVQVFGDGAGKVITLGERDCSAQRRNQKVVEETPAPGLDAATRAALAGAARQLMESVRYRGAGTVEFIFDADTGEFYFLEVNTRLQVEHGVTEQIYGVDLVRWMVELGAGALAPLGEIEAALRPAGHSIQARVYAEDPYKDFQPSAGLLTQAEFPEAPGVRIDHWIYPGIEVSPHYDPMLAKVIVTAEDRPAALARMRETLAAVRLAGIETNLAYLRELMTVPAMAQGEVTTSTLASVAFAPRRIDVVKGGTQTTVQDYPGRVGYWDVGVPPSGPFDDWSFRLGNRLLGNAADAAGLEITLQGPTLRFSADVQIALTGAPIPAKLDGAAVPQWEVVPVKAGQTLVLGTIKEAGARAYLLVRGGVDCPSYLGAKATFTLGQFGGHGGRALRAGDVLHLAAAAPAVAGAIPEALRPAIGRSWTMRVIYGPHGAPDFFTQADIDALFAHAYEVHYNSSRTGVRLVGPKPAWARLDGGEAGLHPSNIHDNAYAPGTIDFTGDMPVILGPDGPSLGGFVCPATIIRADLWQVGQLRAGDLVRFVAVSHEGALEAFDHQRRQLEALAPLPAPALSPAPVATPVLLRRMAHREVPELVVRPSGDDFLLVEMGPQEISLPLRFRVHALMNALHEAAIPGVLEITPGIRSLQVHYVPETLGRDALIAEIVDAYEDLGDLSTAEVTARKVYLPLSWNDPACQEAIDKYARAVRPNAPWVPSNLEFIRRINGLPDVEAVKQIVFDAEYLVMGLGDVYLGAPVATPVDPRHRLVTTKYNPARTWTAENSVGIGGAYLCVYGMEGPGGYQFVGRTLQMWNRYRATPAFTKPWLLRFFDHLQFYPVSHDELLRIRRDFPLGRFALKVEEKRFRLADYLANTARHEAEIAAFTKTRHAAFEAELARWHAEGQFHYDSHEADKAVEQVRTLGEHQQSIDSPVAGSLWQQVVQPGAHVKAGAPVLVLESMKMELVVSAPADGVVKEILVRPGQPVHAGQQLAILEAVAAV